MDEARETKSSPQARNIKPLLEVRGYCVKCRAKGPMVDVEVKMTQPKQSNRKSRPFLRGRCPKCKTTMCRFGVSASGVPTVARSVKRKVADDMKARRRKVARKAIKAAPKRVTFKIPPAAKLVAKSVLYS